MHHHYCCCDPHIHCPHKPIGWKAPLKRTVKVEHVVTEREIHHHHHHYEPSPAPPPYTPLPAPQKYIPPPPGPGKVIPDYAVRTVHTCGHTSYVVGCSCCCPSTGSSNSSFRW
ncbi:putative uncharacterized protein DDB_G0287191 [Euwallacea similis]|uniref:putative uncharacterized protein DDB_G0287191 n=1 Tax=Euwallacea similis TaxID=1736056 RepID=UPI00344C0873